MVFVCKKLIQTAPSKASRHLLEHPHLREKKMRQIHSPFALIVLAAAVGQAYAQSNITPVLSKISEEVKADDVQLPAVTITTGTRSAKSVDKIPGAVNVVSKDELAHTLALTDDATSVLARTVPGYAESSQAMANAGENLRGRVALRLLDGVPQGSPLREGSRSASFTDMGLVGRIEVINGPSASEGIGAAGGIINYISKVPTKMGDEFTLVSRYTTQFQDDSAGWKLGLNYAHKDDTYDLLVGISQIERGMSYDANGRRQGMNSSGSVLDSTANNYFAKGGFNFGANKEQRLQLTASSFKILGKGNYMALDGDRDTGETNTSQRGQPLGAKTEFNDFKQVNLSYKNDEFIGGTLTADAYLADQAMRFVAELDSPAKQDPLFAPVGTLIEQSEIDSRKKGLRTSWTRQDIMGINGMELRTGLDLVQDTAEQRLALTNRTWAPPVKYSSVAPYLQISYDIGMLTLSGGYRKEGGQLLVDTFTTVWANNRSLVEGGTRDYTADLPNIGAILRLPQGWSVFASYGKGFTLPNVGIALRNINRPNVKIVDVDGLEAVVVDNTEIGFNWRGSMGSLGASSYHSKSDLGASLSISPVTNDFVLNRAPVDITGFEFSGGVNFNKQWKASALYSQIRGKTSYSSSGGSLDKEMGVLDINPDKFGLSVTWKPVEKSEITLGATRLFSRDLNVGRNNEEHTTGYTLFDLGSNYDFGKYGRLSLGVENLENRQYILSWSQLPGFKNFFAGRGRVISISHEIKF
jgi:iron complex outermembrane receptor protein